MIGGKKNLDFVIKVLSFLEKKPKILGDNFLKPSIKLIHSDLRKKYSEIHRIIVRENYKASEKEFFWIKIAKGQPNKSVALEKIGKEYKIQKELWKSFQNQNDFLEFQNTYKR